MELLFKIGFSIVYGVIIFYLVKEIVQTHHIKHLKITYSAGVVWFMLWLISLFLFESHYYIHHIMHLLIVTAMALQVVLQVIIPNAIIKNILSYLPYLFGIFIVLLIHSTYSGLSWHGEINTTHFDKVTEFESHQSRFFMTYEVKVENKNYSVIRPSIVHDLETCIGKRAKMTTQEYFLYGLKNGASNKVIINISCK